MINKKQITTDHMLLITRIKKCIIEDELNHKYRLPYNRKWVDKFLEHIVLRGKYSDIEGKLLMEIRGMFINELKSFYTIKSNT